jgi:hypothetical protein
MRADGPAHAIEAFKRAIELGYAPFDIVMVAGLACRQLGRRDEAKKYAVALLPYKELNEESATLAYLCHLSEEEYLDDIAARVPILAERHPNSEFFRFARGFWRYMQGDLNGAAADLGPLARNSAMMRVHLPYAYLLHDLGQDDRVLEHLWLSTWLPGPELHTVVLLTRFPDKFEEMRALLSEGDPEGKSVNQFYTLNTCDLVPMCENCARAWPHKHSLHHDLGNMKNANKINRIAYPRGWIAQNRRGLGAGGLDFGPFGWRIS